MTDLRTSPPVAHVDATELRFGGTYIDVGPQYRSQARAVGWAVVLAPGLVALVVTGSGWFVLGLPGWIPLAVLVAAPLLGAAASRLATSVPTRQVKSRVTITPLGMRWNHAIGGPIQPAEWRIVRWDRVRSLRRVRHVAEGGGETNGLEVVFADGTWTSTVPARHREFWFRTVADAHRRGLVPHDVALVGFARMPAPGEPIAPGEWPAPAETFAELDGSRLRPPI